MTQEDKKLLLKDLCARLSHDVKVAFFNEDLTHHSEPKTLIGIECINNLNYSRLEDEDGNTTIVEFVKPYLFPLSSITEEQKREQEAHFTCIKHDMSFSICKYMEWCYKNHLDINGLIPKGLAIDATGLNIY